MGIPMTKMMEVTQSKKEEDECMSSIIVEG